MTGKRFTLENDIEMKDNWNINKRCYHFRNGFDAKDCCNMLNELQEENKRLKSINQDNCNYIGDFENDFIRLTEENKELQERNNRQCKQLDDLYRLIEQKDWRALSDIMDDFKKSDELLQKEWGDYLDEF